MSDSQAYRVIVIGTGKRGMHHAAAFKANPRFELAGLCDRDAARLAKAAAELGVERTSGDAAALAAETRPDVFCFCTPPTVRLNLIKIGVQSGARLIAYEKPMALSMNEAIEIRKTVNGAGVKTVISHQHRYGEHYAKIKEVLDSGAIGRVHTVYSTAVGWMLHMYTHMIDLMRWYNGGAAAEWVMAQAAGRAKLKDIHPSPDYLAGFIQFSNGARGIIECGAGAPDVPEVDYWWRKNRVGAQGVEGFAEALTGGGWRAATRKGLLSGAGSMDYALDMPPYIADMARWLDDDGAVHPCNGESAYQGFEIMMAMLRSVIHRGQVSLPLGPGEPEIEALARVLPQAKVIASTGSNQKNYEA